jgi:hypothetical protein
VSDIGFKKVGHKARRNRKRNPMPHQGHRKPRRPGSRAARLLKLAVARRFEPTVEEQLGPLAAGVHVSPLRRVALGAAGLTPSFKCEAPDPKSGARDSTTTIGGRHVEQ